MFARCAWRSGFNHELELDEFAGAAPEPAHRRRFVSGTNALRTTAPDSRLRDWRISGLRVLTRSRPAFVIPRVSGRSTAAATTADVAEQSPVAGDPGRSRC